MIRSGNLRTLRHWSVFSFSLLFTVVITFGSRVEAQSLDAEEQTMLRLINDYRAQNGLGQLAASIAITRAAEWHSADMAARNYFSHIDSQGRNPFVRMAAFGYNYQTAMGENIAAGYNDAVRTFNQWKNSAGHNATMLNPNYKVIGIAREYGASSTYRWYWTTDFGGFLDATIGGGGGGGGTTPQTVRVVNAANFFQMISPDSIVATFGSQFTPATQNATSFPLPTTLGGVSVTVNDITAQLFYVSPSQVNFVVPSSVGPGTAMVKVMYNGVVIGSGTVAVENVSPSTFTASANGQGVAAAQTTFDGVSYQPVANSNGTARAITVGTATQPNYLVLYGTGVRRRSSLSAVRVTIGGVALSVDYVGPHSRLAGMDQINVRLPLVLRGRGDVDVIVTVDGRTSNVARIYIGN